MYTIIPTLLSVQKYIIELPIDKLLYTNDVFKDAFGAPYKNDTLWIKL